jgi:CBS domain-containing protein
MNKERPIIIKAITVKSDITVGEALDILQKKGIRSMPVVDAKNRLLGSFSYTYLFKSLLPKSVTMEGGVGDVGFAFDTAPGAAKRLGRLHDMKVSDVMWRDCPRLDADTPTWEMLRLLLNHGSPLPVVDSGSRLLGIISDQSVLESLEEVLDDLEKSGLA